MTRPSLAGIGRIALLALLWGSGFLWIKISLRGFTPVQLTIGRLALGALVLLLLLWQTSTVLPHDRRLWGHLTMAALLGNAVPYLLFGIGEQTVDSNLAGAINATTPLWTLAFALAARTERSVTGTQALGLVLGLAGAVLILSPWQAGGSIGGAIACLAASASYGASYVYMGRYLTHRGLSPVLLSGCQMIAATGLMLPALPFGGLTPPDWRADAIASLLILGILGTGLAYILNYRIITDEGPTLASTVTYLLPVVAVLLGALVLSEPITVQMVSGIAVVLGGVALTRRGTA